uniref:DB domain-containing protein n=1 Tax=Romanomermis culicivorax TaxID=13658 RepID=A0A915II57_ROMCU
MADAQDRKSCDIVENVELLFKCANGMHKQHDLRPCCQKYGAIKSKLRDEDMCSQFCHPHQSEEFLLKPETIFCASRLKVIGYCHFIHLDDKK